jgi:alpha-methylacyl-CoA racemase
VPAVPRLSRTPARALPLDLSDHTAEVLAEIGLSKEEALAAAPAEDESRTGLAWPPELR